MEAQLHRQQGYEDPQNAGLQPVVDDEQHHERKSVLKKVKDKAKKIKNTITKRGHGDHDEHDSRGSDDLEEDEGDEDDQMEEDPAVHASSAYKPGVTSSDTNGGQGVNLEKPTALREDRYPMQVDEPTSGSGYVSGRPMAAEPEGRSTPSLTGMTGVNSEKQTALGEDRYPMQVNEPTSGYVSGRPRAAEQEGGSAPSLTDITGKRVLDPSGASKKDEGMQKEGIKIGGLTDLQEDAPTPMDSSNYQTKTVDLSGKGGQEADIDPLIRSLEKTSIQDKSGVRESPASTGSHDQFAPESHRTDKIGIGSDSFPKTYDSSKPEDLPQDTIHGKASDKGSYIGMIAGAPSAISGKAIAAKNAVASKLGYGGTESVKSPESGVHESPASTGSNDQFAPESHPTDKIGIGSDSTPKTYDSTRPEDLQGKASDQGSYIGKIAGVPSTITDKAIAAKNVVASKVGYGGTESLKAPESGVRESPSATGSNDQFALASESLPTDKIGIGSDSTPKTYDSSKPEDLPQDTIQGKASDQGSYIGKITGVPSTIADKAIAAKNVVASKLGYGGTESATAPETGEFVGAEKSAASSTPYMQGVTSKVTGTLAPVYAKVADTGSSVISRVKGTGGKEETSDINKEGTSDKGVSMKDYLSEKFRPGEEDKALSREISDALHARKENLVKTGEPKSVGKVIDATEGQSTILAEAKREGDDVKVVGPESVNKGVVDMVKDTVSSWVGKGGQQQHTQGSPDASHPTTEGQAAGEIGHPLSVSEDKKMD